MKKKFKMNASKLSLCDFKNHAIESNITSSIAGGFPKITHAKSVILTPFAKVSGPIYSQQQ